MRNCLLHFPLENKVADITDVQVCPAPQKTKREGIFQTSIMILVKSMDLFLKHCRLQRRSLKIKPSGSDVWHRAAALPVPSWHYCSLVCLNRKGWKLRWGSHGYLYTHVPAGAQTNPLSCHEGKHHRAVFGSTCCCASRWCRWQVTS